MYMYGCCKYFCFCRHCNIFFYLTDDSNLHESPADISWKVSISMFCGLLVGSLCSSLLFIIHIRHKTRHAEIQQQIQEEPYYEIETLRSNHRNQEHLNSQHNGTEQVVTLHNMSDESEVSSETDCSDETSNRVFQGEHIQLYENAYHPLDLHTTEIHLYDETCLFNAVNSSNYMNTQIFNTQE